MVRLLTIELVEHGQQRYDTPGDWIVQDDGSILVRVSDTGVRLDALLVGIHEAVEAILCRERGISGSDVDIFDISFKGEGEPGEYPTAPYRREHATADVVERAVALEAGVVWQEYSGRVDSLARRQK